MTDFHGYKDRLRRTLNQIEREDIPLQDRKIIKEFFFHCQAQGVSLGRLSKLSWTLLGLKTRWPVPD